MIKPLLSKIKFELGFEPKLESINERQKYIPDNYKSVILISADFELAWAWRYTKSSNNPYKKTIEKAKQERENIPGILNVCERYNIPITWATVGHLFLESCAKENQIAHPNLPRLGKFENTYWKFEGMDWFEHDPCSNLANAPEWYCPDLIRQIQGSKVKHEFGCHTFSHIDCRDEVCSPEVMRAEINECKKLAKEFGINMTSFVHPGHTIGNLDVLADEGFTNFRTDYNNKLGYPKRHKNGIWELQQTAEFNLRAGWSLDYHIYRYKKIVEKAINSNTVCVFWFHPSFSPEFVNVIWPHFFKFLNDKRQDLWITTHNEYFDWLNNRMK